MEMNAALQEQMFLAVEVSSFSSRAVNKLFGRIDSYVSVFDGQKKPRPTQIAITKDDFNSLLEMAKKTIAKGQKVGSLQWKGIQLTVPHEN